jgi:anaerobic dimethyl sulfoxide reductase subunit B (iron-sulfur subunit)
MSLGFYFDMTRCVGCRACQVACKDRNNLNLGMVWRTTKTYETGSFPKVGMYNYAATCNHCENPACVEICPVGAMYKAEDGTVLHDDEMCIGCQACVSACPYAVPQFDEEASIVRKCDACASIRAKGGNPVCVDACPSRALDFGDKDELIEKYGPDLVQDIAILPDSGITGSNTLIKAKACALEEEYRELPT